MCGIFGIIGSQPEDFREIDILARCAETRGRDSSGLAYFRNGRYHIMKADRPITKLLKRWSSFGVNGVLMGHSRLITNGLGDNQPVVRDGVIALHNGIVVNDERYWETASKQRTMQIDSEVIVAAAAQHLESGGDAADIAEVVLNLCEGVVACALAIPRLGKLLLFSNNGSLYIGKKNGATYFSSEYYPLTKIGCDEIEQRKGQAIILEIPRSDDEIIVSEERTRVENLVPDLVFSSQDESLLLYPKAEFRRCARCILPETMPYISFDSAGVCNYCHTYKIRNNPKPTPELAKLIEPYRRARGNDCIVPFSGGRDSCYALHLIVKELEMRPVAYTYDWGMVTDLGRRNISRMCAELGVENIVVAADIEKKRHNIRKNIKAWLKSPHLGMISVFTAGDKHFFRYLETVKEQTGISLNLWGVNPLEVTHFKAGFLGVPPDFATKTVYNSGLAKQVDYHAKRFRVMLHSLGYFNSSLWDTISGEYYRAVMPKKDYFHIFDYWTWEERLVDDTLAQYDWERAKDTTTTWRIGDGTAAFYNYIYRTVAGFSEHDTFRSNQIREGQLTREEALRLVEDENRPRYANLKWYLDAVNLDFADTIQVVNSIPRLYT
jgi:glucosamine--fructose-6-phosphate aminotransferase (isomerizing)